MGFSAKQVSALQRKPDQRHVKTREVNGRELSYIEGWYAISEANRIFGFDAWNRETADTKCVLARENRGTFHAVYTARVRITVGRPLSRYADPSVSAAPHSTHSGDTSVGLKSVGGSEQPTQNESSLRPFEMERWRASRSAKREGW